MRKPNQTYFDERRERGMRLLHKIDLLWLDVQFYGVESASLMEVMSSQCAARSAAKKIKEARFSLMRAIEQTPGETTKQMIARKMDSRWSWL